MLSDILLASWLGIAASYWYSREGTHAAVLFMLFALAWFFFIGYLITIEGYR